MTITGAGYVGLVTGACLAEKGHEVICFDIDKGKIEQLRRGEPPIYEPGLKELIEENIKEGRLHFTTDSKEAYRQRDVIVLAVGTPEKEDGSPNLSYLKNAVDNMACHINQNCTVVTKSTVPPGTNEKISYWIHSMKNPALKVEVISCPEFLREGAAIHDTFHGDRIVIGAASKEAGDLIEEMYKDFNVPIVRTDIRSAEMIKYASNAFLAAKISFINEIANICERVGADIEEVAAGMGLDNRIGRHFLKAGIGYGGSCFPKDTKALHHIAGKVKYQFEILEAVMKVNDRQSEVMMDKARTHLGSLKRKKAALLGLAFKPGTDDIRESQAIKLAKALIHEGANVHVYDPVAMHNAEQELGNAVVYSGSMGEALLDAEAAFIVTEWEEIIEYPLSNYSLLMKEPVILDGRNCLPMEKMKENNLTYLPVGRKGFIPPIC
ncbi:UDP-glucose dehydrogenase family protein [Rossellomorea vietnamensis]|uniref:UDP-glucose dehydrogenase family protein n=1 Tax=Rossellomorea vietnamensis TaxID=218284 RepID=UPI003CF700AC